MFQGFIFSECDIDLSGLYVWYCVRIGFCPTPWIEYVTPVPSSSIKKGFKLSHVTFQFRMILNLLDRPWSNNSFHSCAVAVGLVMQESEGSNISPVLLLVQDTIFFDWITFPPLWVTILTHIFWQCSNSSQIITFFHHLHDIWYFKADVTKYVLI